MVVRRKVYIGLMCAMTLICIVSAVRNNIFRDIYMGMISSVEIFGLAAMTAMSFFVFPGIEKTLRSMQNLSLLFLNIFVSIFFYCLGYTMYMVPGMRIPVIIFITLSYFFGMGLFLTLWLYEKQFLEESLVTRIVTVLIVAVQIVYSVLLIINLFWPILFHVTSDGVFNEHIVDYYSITADAFCLILLCIGTFTSNLSWNRKLSFLSCILVPAMFVTIFLNQESLSWSIYIWGVLAASIMLPMYLIFFNVHDELEKDVLRHEKKQIELQVSAMISQMQPHFLYNSLAIIAALCEEDPKLAAEATNAFSGYLRENMDFADRNSPITFTQELEHIKTYVWLEKLRFPNKLNVEYDIKSTAFHVPALSVQPIVENAIKHGICRSRKGGTVKLSTYEADEYYLCVVSDDGVGFDVQKLKTSADTALSSDVMTIADRKSLPGGDRRAEDVTGTQDNSGRRHLGIENTRYRLREMVSGSLEIESTPGRGTTVTIRIPKRNEVH